jgi:hypothetical protein
VDPRDLERLLVTQRRQDRRQAAREHRLAGPGRARHQHVVAAGRRGDQAVDDVAVASDVAQVHAR